jgi:putative DNA-invertase from lambdoid prophage Rac
VVNSGGKNGQIRVAIYARVSTKDQNCDRQIADLQNYAQLAGYRIVATHAEKASGTKNDRIERKTVINLARSRCIDAVLVTELSRWGRSTIDLMHTLNELASYNVSLIAQTGMTFDLSTPHGKLIAQILSSMAEFERDLICERISSGIANARAKGKIFGRRKVDTSDRCHKVNALRCQGLSERAIGKNLNLSKSTVNKCARSECLSEGMDW